MNFHLGGGRWAAGIGDNPLQLLGAQREALSSLPDVGPVRVVGANVATDGGASWTTQSNQPMAQFYRLSVDNDFPYRILGPQQDNTAVASGTAPSERASVRAIGKSLQAARADTSSPIRPIPMSSTAVPTAGF